MFACASRRAERTLWACQQRRPNGPAGLVLAVEALSPTTARADRHKKRHIYMEEAVDEYWIVDLDGRVIERWRKGDVRPDVLADILNWQPRSDIQPLVIELTGYFAGVHQS